MILLTDRQKNIIKEVIEWIVCIVIAIVIAVLIRYFVGTPTVVKQASMFPTLKQDQRLWLNRLPRTLKEMPKRGEIITFEAPSSVYVPKDEADLNNPVAKYENEPKGLFSKFTYYVLETKNYETKEPKEKVSFIKRVIGLPGEHVQIKDGKVYINDVELEEPYLNENVYTDSLEGVFTDLIVPENCVFAMGDNRSQSTDCRRFGCVPIEKIESKVLFRFWPLNLFGKVE